MLNKKYTIHALAILPKEDEGSFPLDRPAGFMPILAGLESEEGVLEYLFASSYCRPLVRWSFIDANKDANERS